MDASKLKACADAVEKVSERFDAMVDKSSVMKEIERLRVVREKAETAKERDAAHVKITNLNNELKSKG